MGGTFGDDFWFPVGTESNGRFALGTESDEEGTEKLSAKPKMSPYSKIRAYFLF